MKKIERKDLEQIKVISSVTAIEKKNKGFYILNGCDIKHNRHVKELWAYDLETMDCEKIQCDSGIRLIRNYENALMAVFRTDSGSVFKSYDVETKTFDERLSLPFEINDFYYDNTCIYFVGSLLEDLQDTDLKRYKNLGIERVHKLYKYNMVTGSIVLISEEDQDLDKLDYNALAGQLVYTAYLTGGMKGLTSNLYLYDTKTSRLTCLSQEKYRIGDVTALDNTDIYFTGLEIKGKSRNDDKSIYRVSVTEGEIQKVALETPCSFEEMGVYTDSHYFDSKRCKAYKDGFYYIGVNSQGEFLGKIDLKSGKNHTIENFHSIDSFALTDRGLVIAGLQEMALHEIYLVTDHCKQVSHHNDWLKKKTVSHPIKLDGPIDGWVIPPTKREENKTYPAVLVIHGGPKGMFAPAYSHDMQILANEGYYVLFANPHGSDGRGDEFANIRGVFGQKAYEDLMDFVDRGINEYPAIDSERLGVMGGSYGGYMTNYIISHTDRFSAAVSARGISSLINSFFSSDIGFEYVYEYMGNRHTPWSDPEGYRQASPLYRADKIKTPTLFLHGQKDNRCHYTESSNMYSALLYNQVDTKLCLFEGEAHGFVSRGQAKNRLKRLEELMTWFKKYL